MMALYDDVNFLYSGAITNFSTVTYLGFNSTFYMAV